MDKNKIARPVLLRLILRINLNGLQSLYISNKHVFMFNYWILKYNFKKHVEFFNHNAKII